MYEWRVKVTSCSFDIIGDLESRGLVAQLSSGDELPGVLSTPRTLYAGFDPTAESLHIGNLVPLLALRRFQLAGHRPIALVGGATGLIGDPSFKASERQLNSSEVVEHWVDRIKSQVSQYVDFDSGSSGAIVVNNLDWVRDLNVLEFLRQIGKHFSVNSMIQKDSVKQRLEREGAGISFTEFTYMILQSFDFSELYKRYGCVLQIGGSDQWGNITGGIELTRRLHQAQVYGLTIPLVTKADGQKFGKTETGTVWLNANKTSPYAFYQFWLNAADADVYRFLRYFTLLSPALIGEIEISDKSALGKPEAQRILAREVTRIVHGEAGFEAAERISEALFSGDVARLSHGDFEQLRLDGVPSTILESTSMSLVSALVSVGLAASNRIARELIASRSISLNGVSIESDEYLVNRENVLFDRYALLRRGKKTFHLLCLAD
jgi:tyrosyl-tRNA synthetase